MIDHYVISWPVPANDFLKKMELLEKDFHYNLLRGT